MTTDEPDEQLAPASPEDEARIRALLSGARVTEPMPTDVVARLDDTLVGLAAGRTTVDPVPADHVVPLARARRHRVVAVLGAAAAVVVVGLAIGSSVDRDAGDGDAGSADDSFQRGAPEEAGGAEATAPSESPADHRDDDLDTSEEEVYREGDGAYVVRSRQLTRDLAQIQGRVLDAPAGDDYGQALVYAPQDFDCRLPQQGGGVLVGVRYDGGPAFVRFLEPVGESQVVEVLQCGTGDLLRSTTLPTRG